MAKNSQEVQRRADSKREGTRVRNWTAILYPDDLPDNWRELLDGTHVRWVESPFHDRDKEDDGTPKKPHYHVMLLYDSIKNYKQVKEMFVELYGSAGDSIVGVAPPKKVESRTQLIRYFAHIDNPEKAQYDSSEIIGHNGVDVSEIWKYSATEIRAMVVAMEQYIEDNAITELCDFSAQIRDSHPEWHTVLTTKMTLYFTSFIRSRRHKAMGSGRVKIDQSTGEIIFRG